MYSPFSIFSLLLAYNSDILFKIMEKAMTTLSGNVIPFIRAAQMSTPRKLAVVFDIDGTLLDITHRLKYIKSTPKDWKTFRDPTLKQYDTPRYEIIAVLLAMYESNHSVVLASGRTESEREDTLQSLHPFIPFVDDLAFYMRREGDYSKDTIVKAEMHSQMLEDGFVPELVFDDRPSVIEMWRSLGVSVADVGPGVAF